MKFKTLSIHAGQGPDPAYGAVMTPIYQTSTFGWTKVSEPPKFDYSRSGNPTRKALEECLAALENGTHAYTFSTGMSAIATLFAMYGPGDHLLIHDDLYGGTYRLLTEVVKSKGVHIEFIDLRNHDGVRAAIRPETKLIWIETPTNPMMNLVDLEAIAAIAKEKGVRTGCDNTFLSPYFQNPLDLGIDIVMHSSTKYINGHSDVVSGCLIVKDEELAQKIAFLQNALGTCPGPMDCFLQLRGIKTLAIRMEEHNKNALAIAHWLEAHPKIDSVLHPGLESHPQHDLARRQARGFGGTFSFRVKGGENEARIILEETHLFTLAESLGGVESLIESPWSMTHVSVPEQARANMGITQNLIRISVGIEDVEDLIADLSQALDKI